MSIFIILISNTLADDMHILCLLLHMCTVFIKIVISPERT